MVLVKVSPDIKDPQFLIDLIDFHKHGTTAQATPQPLIRDQHKRPKTQTKVTPDDTKPATLPSRVDTDANRVLFTAFLRDNGMMPTFGETHPPKASAVNNTDGNKYQDVYWAQTHLAITRKDNWICTKGTGSSSYFSNPKKAVRTLFNWHDKDITASDLDAIQYIHSLKEPILLAESIKSACHNCGITLTRGRKSFADLFSCKDPADNPILIIAVA